MKCTYGITDMLPEEFTRLLPRNVTHSFVPTARADVVLLPTVDLLRANFQALDRRRQLAVFVFDVDVHLKNWQIPRIEAERQAVRRALATPNTIQYRPRNPIKSLLAASTGSFVSSLLTLVHRIRDPQRQKDVRDCVFLSIYRDQVADLVSSLSAPELSKILLSDDCQRLVAAIKLVQSGKSAKAAAAANNVSTFDVQYTLKYIDRLKKGQA